MATKPYPFEKSPRDKESKRFGKEGSAREEAADKKQAGKKPPFPLKKKR